MKTINVTQFQTVLGKEQKNKEMAFINVCTPQEYAQAHIPGVRSMPLSDLPNRAQELAHKKKIYIHCISGARSAMAIGQLQQMGIKAEMINVEGGINAWQAAGYPIQSMHG